VDHVQWDQQKGVKNRKSIPIFSHSNAVQSYLCIAEKKTAEYPMYQCGIAESLGLIAILTLNKMNQAGNQTLSSHNMGSNEPVGSTPNNEMTLSPF
jgi:hypothetical protein